MKRFTLTLSLVILTLVSIAQTMTRTVYTKAGGATFNHITYTATCPVSTTNWVVIFVGSGEGGLDDGSQITKIEGVESYAKQAKNGKSFPFNIMIVQPLKTASMSVPSYSGVHTVIKARLAALGATKYVLTGFSLGGQEIIRRIFIDHDSNCKGFVSMAGKMPGGPESVLKGDAAYTLYAQTTPVFLLHGKKDTAVSWYNSNTLATKLNAAHPGQCTTLWMPEGTHSDSWTKGYNTTDQYGSQVYNFILSRLQ